MSPPEDFSGAIAIQDEACPPELRIVGFMDAARTRPVSADTLFDIGSVTKTFTAASVDALARRGALSLADPIDRFVGDLPAVVRPIRIEHLLNHTSGLADFLRDDGTPTDYTLQRDYEPLSRGGLLDRLRATRLLFAPGGGWSYSNTAYNLLAAIVEIASGARFGRFLEDAVLRPHRLTETTHHPADRAAAGISASLEWTPPHLDISNGWNLLGAGGLFSTIGNLHAWNVAHFRRVDTAVGPAGPAEWPAAEAGIRSGRACFWRDAGPPTGPLLYHNGGNTLFSSTIRWYPQRRRHVTVLSNRAEHSAMSVARQIADGW